MARKIIDDEGIEGTDEVVAESTESEAPESSTEAPEASTEQAPATKPETKPEEEVDLTAFNEVYESAIASVGADGNPTPEAVAAVQEAYHGLEGAKSKGAARNHLKTDMKASVKDKNMSRALAITVLEEEMTKGGKKASGGGGATKKPVDPTEAFIEQQVTLDLARTLLVRPEGLAENVDEQAKTLFGQLHPQTVSYLAWLTADKDSRGDEPEVSATVKAAAKLASGKKAKASGGGGSRSAFTGTRRDVGKHIEQAFADQASGTFLKVGDVAKAKTEEYPEGDASAGAVSSRFESGKLPEGITAETRDKVKGFVKA